MLTVRAIDLDGTLDVNTAPQQAGQISPCTPGQCRFARLFSHNLQGMFTA